MSDALTYTLLGWDDSTRLAPRFKEERFKTIFVGMDRKTVLERVGPPLRVTESAGGRLVWYYALGPSDASYWLRFVVLDSAGKVESIERTFFFD